MNDYTERQIADLLELMPELMMYLRNRAEAGDNGARSLFNALDNHCWHQPETCGVGMTCEGGKQRARPPAMYCPRCNRTHERDGEAEEKCREGMRFADADHRRRGGTI